MCGRFFLCFEPFKSIALISSKVKSGRRTNQSTRSTPSNQSQADLNPQRWRIKWLTFIVFGTLTKITAPVMELLCRHTRRREWKRSCLYGWDWASWSSFIFNDLFAHVRPTDNRQKHNPDTVGLHNAVRRTSSSRSRGQIPAWPRNFRRDWSWSIFYGHFIQEG